MQETVLRFTQADFDAFGRLSGDLNPIHVDPEFSAHTRFGRTVAHGMMLFATIAAAIAEEGEVTISGQELTFPSPTYAESDHFLRLHEENSLATSSVLAADGTVTATGRTWLGVTPDLEPRSTGVGASRMKGLAVGDAASVTRRFERQDTADLVGLVGDPNPLHRGSDATLPPALLGGLVSLLLGMSLPGPGTNWLKQRFRFLAPVPATAEVTATVRITRLRPHKDLVDLECECQVAGEVVMTGDSLVLVRDLSG